MKHHSIRTAALAGVLAIVWIAIAQAQRDDEPFSLSVQSDLESPQPLPAVAAEHFQIPLETPAWAWTIGYRSRTLVSSVTSYEFGMPAGVVPAWSPLSRLDFPLNSLWHGLGIGLQGPKREFHFEWLMPQQGIDGELADYDWCPPNPDGSYTDLGYCKQRWTEGQMLDLSWKSKWSNTFFACRSKSGRWEDSAGSGSTSCAMTYDR